MDKQKLSDAYLREIYYLGRYRLTRKYALLSATGSELLRRLVL